MRGKAARIDPASISTHTFDWGAAKWFITPSQNAAALTFGEVVVMPGGGHSRHNHPDAEEVLYFLSGEGEQTLDDGDPFRVVAGDTIYIPVGVFHSTINTGWEPMRVLALYNPGGSEQGLAELPDFREAPAGALTNWTRG